MLGLAREPLHAALHRLTYFQHKLPPERSSTSRWRGRVGKDTLVGLLAETSAAAGRAKTLDPSKTARVSLDTTAQTKAVVHPTDSLLLLRALE